VILKIGTRKSKLAIIQTELVIKQINKYYPEVECKIIPIITTGDKIKDKNLYEIGGKALFLKEIEEALQRCEIDIAVHSFKDVPGTLNAGLTIAAVLERGDAREVFVSKKYSKIVDLPRGATVGTSSVRRKAFLLRARPDLKIVPFRGNVDSRVRKILDNAVDATLLTAAGLQRLGLFDSSYCHIIDPKEILPAPCQGVIAVEIKRDAPKFIKEICARVNHEPTFHLMRVERGFVEYLNANCDCPLAAYAVYDNGKINANFMLEQNGELRFHTEVCDITGTKEVGIRAAVELLR
jgi:hydroxymethylbilane synthase